MQRMYERRAGRMSLDPSTLYSMQYIETSTIEKLYTFNVTEKVLTELGNVNEQDDGYICRKAF